MHVFFYSFSVIVLVLVNSCFLMPFYLELKEVVFVSFSICKQIFFHTQPKNENLLRQSLGTMKQFINKRGLQ